MTKSIVESVHGRSAPQGMQELPNQNNVLTKARCVKQQTPSDYKRIILSDGQIRFALINSSALQLS